jgi:5-hydroxyisourate hydrolase
VSVISTHVLDLARGQPGEGMRVRLERLATAARSEPAAERLAGAQPGAEGPEVVASARTDQDGRARLAEGAAVQPGTYRLVFDTGAYLAAQRPGEPPFFPEVAITFAVAGPDRGYHVPLLLSPYGYSTYRGS